MLSMEDPAVEFAGSTNDPTVIRHKRHRTAAVDCSSSAEGDHHRGSTSSPTVSGGEIYESTEEEEDMANCLILLARGDVTNTPQQPSLPESSTNRNFTADSAVKVSFYAYECKTCNRTFSSFQALGGHRASHKRPKTAPEKEAVAAAVEEISEIAGNRIPFAIPIARSSAVSVNREQLDDSKLAGNCQIPPLSLKFVNHITTTAINQKSFLKPNKTHECSICGSEFSSGQALGGHMRRHRAAAVASATTTTTANSTNSTAVDHQELKISRNILELDLNLPAPEDDLRESKFQFSSPKQSLIFSTPTLIDCHY